MRSPRPSPRRLALLGATGSIGRQVCDLVERHPDRFALHAVIAGTDAAALDAVARRHPEAHALLANPGGSDAGRAARAIAEAVSDPDVDLVVVAAAGAAALAPTLSALDAGKDIALATKEVLVMAGELVRQRMRRHGSQIFPIDSEHSAIWQCLWGEKEAAVRRLILTGSGGPFLRRPLETLESVTIAEALAHPRWKMGPKITIDSATMMNKGLEVIEAHFLFDVPYSAIDVIVHPQSVVHSMVEFVDGSVKAQLGIPDMHLPIAIALGFPERLDGVTTAPDLAALGQLSFEALDAIRYPAVALAREAGERGGTAPAVLNAANEEAVALFLKGQRRFVEIVPSVRQAVESAAPDEELTLDTVIAADRWARAQVRTTSGGTSRVRSELPA
ncbi:MAG: 1-deoxy-D-xylulose-5-phosphate reductoisomerase [Chloroflexi bacterium]|nr:MAG: 1-deoxy-D-xylulose-5-phosphate reductoisomerase [Chloroflexota bacterium]TMF24803.1 MAG: 1-deoxy-D-xylulose-5-phosphate reductoisomerase [Chloroflexota bacterium]TMF50347.1 MAG: 1-deoxy-D-xylulose-5-phosphate reductoisomerase [Chloroflexota bacterium]TMG15194.1 MAG: 1-deoxy-D-xylulose-5-phosphate reductoisomerase [Chloroflexota bacterium]TMG50130.1 MAG: 1-deoxy-D-xylulose-5-phosphate reductoisomerase [Chloroflexota bacterium]